MQIMSYHIQPPAIKIPSLQDKCSATEWEMRVDLAACYRLVDLFGMSDLISTHISAHIPGTEEFLVNPYGYLFNEMTASSLVKINLQGEILARADDSLNVNPSAFVLHGAIHEAREDAVCIVHTHTRAGQAVAALECGLLPLNQSSMRFHNSVGYHDFEGPVVELGERERVKKSLGKNNALILRNHGLLTCAATIAEAFYLMRSLERSCQVQIDAMSCGVPLNMAPEGVLTKTHHQFQRTTRRAYGVLEWPALLRKLDTIDPGYRQ